MAQPTCPKCFNGFVRRSRRAGLLDHLFSWFSVYPFRCQLCGHRFQVRQKGVTYTRNQEDRRDYERLPVSLPASFSAGACQGEGTITDLSIAGCTLQAEVGLAAGNLLHLVLHLPGQAEPVEVDLAVLRSVLPGRAKLEFIEFADRERERLRPFVRGLLAPVATGPAEGHHG